MKTFFCLALLYVISVAQKVEAQSTDHSSINLVFREFDVKAEVSLPLAELEIAFGKELQDKPDEKIQRYKVELNKYILSHISAKGPDGLSWQSSLIDEFSIQHLPEEPSYLVFALSLRSPNVQSQRALELSSDIIIHKILNHRILVIVKSDWGTGITSENPEGVGVLFPNHNELSIDRGKESSIAGVFGLFKIGATRVKTEFYHLLFILVLLLSMTATYKNSFFDYFKTLSAFAMGHFINLLIMGAAAMMLSLRWVEVLFAATIIVFIVHSFRPLFPKKEWFISLLFGFTYGFISSGIIAEFGISAGPLLIGSVGLSLGVLCMQLVIVLLFSPWFYIAAKGNLYPIFKNLILLAAMLICIVWINARVFNAENILSPLLNAAVEHPEWIFLFTAVGCLLIRYQKPDNIR